MFGRRCMMIVIQCAKLACRSLHLSNPRLDTSKCNGNVRDGKFDIYTSSFPRSQLALSFDLAHARDEGPTGLTRGPWLRFAAPASEPLASSRLHALTVAGASSVRGKTS